ncbi:Uncharacterized protein GBIM_00206 [Gryllus bimaculatus]|nr:Uncharacterized protein GBIM_00206 [Gryllus bimaculatus]
MDPSPQQIQELRSKFLQKLETDGAPAPEGFHAADLAKVKNGDDWLRRFLVHCELDMNLTLQMLWDTCEWRSKFGTNEITENNVKREYLEDGSLYVHNRDIDGRSLLIFNCKKHVKGQRDMDDLKRCVVYWFERLERMDKGKPVTIFFDMAETGLANMDMDFTKYLISLFKQYYPDFLNYIIIFEMPWILNAAFKIIKSWLPAKAVQKIRFVNKGSLKTVVNADQALKVWGGQDDYTFSFVPEQKSASTERADKKVHFADGSPLNESFPGGFGDAQSKQDGLPNNNVSLQITPPDAISFTIEGTEMTGTITLTNNDDKIISYKIKTTSPEKFRVRPSTGVLAPSESVSINVVLQPGYQLAGLSRDKFLIMNLPVDSTDMSPQELAELWKQTSGKNVGHHRLKCNLGSATPESALKNGTAFSTTTSMDLEQQIRQIASGVSQLRDHHEKLCADLRFTQKLQWLTIGIVLLGFILAVFFSQRHSSGETCFAGDEHSL